MKSKFPCLNSSVPIPLSCLKLGEPVKVRVDSFADKEFPGTVEQIARSAEFTPRNTQTVEERIKQVFGVKIRLNNEGDKLRAKEAASLPRLSCPGR